MSNPGISYYDLQATIEALESRLLGRLADTKAELAEAIADERRERQDALEALERVLHSRTEHLA